MAGIKLDRSKMYTPTYFLFFKTHFEYDVKRPGRLIPMNEEGNLVFPENTLEVVPKKLTFLDKLTYYIRDLRLWLESR